MEKKVVLHFLTNKQNSKTDTYRIHYCNTDTPELRSNSPPENISQMDFIIKLFIIDLCCNFVQQSTWKYTLTHSINKEHKQDATIYITSIYHILHRVDYMQKSYNPLYSLPQITV